MNSRQIFPVRWQHGFHLAGKDSLTKNISLHFRKARLHHHGELLRGFNAFRQGIDSEIPA